MSLIESDSVLGLAIQFIKEQKHIDVAGAIEAALAGLIIAGICIATGKPWEYLPYAVGGAFTSKSLDTALNLLTRRKLKPTST